MKKQLFGDNKGFTLVEILGAITIISIVLLGLFTLFPQTAYMQNTNEDKLTAVNLSNLVLEDLRNIDETTLSAGTFQQFNQTGSIPISSVNNDGQFLEHPRFRLEIQLESVDDFLRAMIRIYDENHSELMRTYDLIEVSS